MDEDTRQVEVRIRGKRLYGHLAYYHCTHNEVKLLSIDDDGPFDLTDDERKKEAHKKLDIDQNLVYADVFQRCFFMGSKFAPAECNHRIYVSMDFQRI